MQDAMLSGPEGIKKTILHGGTADILKFTTGAKVPYKEKNTRIHV